MLNLAYNPAIPKTMIEMLEHYGKRMGMALDEMETVGQSLESVEKFILEVEMAQTAVVRDLCTAGIVRSVAHARRPARA